MVRQYFGIGPSDARHGDQLEDSTEVGTAFRVTRSAEMEHNS